MSAPILACSLADAIGALMIPLCESMGAKTRVDYFPAEIGVHDEFWNVSIHDHGACFSGTDFKSPGTALIKANTDRQAFEEKATKLEFGA